MSIQYVLKSKFTIVFFCSRSAFIFITFISCCSAVLYLNEIFKSEIQLDRKVSIQFNSHLLTGILNYGGLPNYYTYFVYVSLIKSPNIDNTYI